MAQTLVPHMVNDQGVDRIAIGVKEFQCMGASPPHDHPHVYLDMGHEAQIVCPYCSTLFVHDGALEATESDATCIYRHCPPGTGGLTPPSSMAAGRARSLPEAASAASPRYRLTSRIETVLGAPASPRDRRGIQIGPMPRACLPLGVLELIEPHAFAPEQIVIRDGHRPCSPLCRSRRVEDRHGAPISLHRADLHADFASPPKA
jgi:uncharacterized Zn-finger protein